MSDSLKLLRDGEVEMSVAHVQAAKAFVDVATVGIFQERAVADLSAIKEQWQRALGSRVVIEQAKGVVPHALDLDMDAAYRLRRDRARSPQTSLAQLVRAIAEESMAIEATEPSRGSRDDPTDPQAVR